MNTHLHLGRCAALASVVVTSATSGVAAAQALTREVTDAPTAQMVPKASSPLEVSLPGRLAAPGLAVAGGVSLGSYGAGFLYYYTLARHLAGEGAPLEVVTGASAGSINAVLAALAMCAEPSFSPEDNLFFNTWIPVGMEKQFDGTPGLRNLEAVTSRALFSRAPIDATANKLKAIFEDPHTRWTQTGCSTLLGLVSTQLIPQRVGLQHLGDGVTPSVARQSQRFLIRLDRRPQQPPTLTPDISKVGHPANPNELKDLFPILGRATLTKTDPLIEPISFDLLADLLKASSSFPFAFEPYRLPSTVYRYKGAGGAWTYAHDPSLDCPAGSEASCAPPEYIDGGIYENVPLHLAQRMQSWWLLGNTTVVVDTEATPGQRPERRDQARKELIPLLSGLVGSVLSSTMAAELFSTFEDNGALRGEASPVAFTIRQLPTASGHFANFLGFFDRDFRVFDFYLGMLDAQQFVGTEELALPKGAYKEQWGVLSCFAAWRRASTGFTRFPKQGTIDACEALRVGHWDANKRAWKVDEHSDLDGAVQKSRYNMVRLLAAAQHFRRHEENAPNMGLIPETDLWFSLMKTQQVDLQDVSDEELDSVRLLVRDRLFGLLDALASKQPGTTSVGLQLAIRTAANMLDYREPRFTLATGLHAIRGFELGAGITRKQFRFEANFRLANVDLRSEKTKGADIRVGPRFVWAAGRHFSSLFQLEPFVGLGYYATYHPDGRSYGLKPELGVYLVLLQHLYLSAAVSTRHRLWKQASYDRAMYARLENSWEVFGSMGWRFLWQTAK
ncbi:MAG: hypothetical protein RLZZ450_2409 [Pseudomonadota bacterium]|jgi:predicted acylesterase/phospholipase RssA